MLASLVVLIFIVHPLGEIGVAGRWVTSVAFSMVLVSGALAVARDPTAATLVGAVVLGALFARWSQLWFTSEPLVLSTALVSLLFSLAVAGLVLARVFRRGRITRARIQGAVAGYLLLGLAWAFAYDVVALTRAKAFSTGSVDVMLEREPISHFVYFSFVTLTTVGFGDVTAVDPVARSLVTLEALVGQLFPAVLLARLVAMELSERHAAVSTDRR